MKKIIHDSLSDAIYETIFKFKDLSVDDLLKALSIHVGSTLVQLKNFDLSMEALEEFNQILTEMVQTFYEEKGYEWEKKTLK